MTDDTPTQSSDRLDQIIAEYLAAEESGAAPPPEEVLAANPNLADELRRFFANRDELAAALPGEPPRKQFVPPRVRYFGDYELLDEIARGGMGVVYRAKQTNLNRIVAIKMILSGHLAGEDDVRRFRTEAEAAANLKHPGIVPVHEVGVHEGHHYFSMDYIEGRSLAEIVRKNPLPARKAAEYVRSIADAVHYAHQQGTLHRDLKPSNILIDGDDHVHVTDFGLAGRVDGDGDLTRTGQILGTPSYMPPEQAQGKRGQIGPASDVYSLGAILYELLTGHSPFRAESSVETLRQVIEREPVAPRALNSIVPRDLETICLKCLRKEPSKRYATAAALAEDLGRWLKHEPIVARPVSRTEKAWMWCRRRPAVAGSIGVVLVAGVLFAVLVTAERQRYLRENIETAVAAVGSVRGEAVQFAVNSLGAFPADMVQMELRRQFEAGEEADKLALAYALAHFDEVRIEFLLAQVAHARPGEVDNLVTALGHSKSDAVAALEAAARIATDEENWRHKARLAMLALHLNAPSLAMEMSVLRPYPVQRTWFIEECSTWHGDLSKLAEVIAESDNGPLRSAVALAAGSAPEADVTATDKQAWEGMLSNWYQNEADTLTHSAAGWTLRKWGLEEPRLRASAQPVEGDWHVNGVGMTMLKIPAGSFVRRDVRDENAANQRVTLTRSFLLGDREVSRAQFQQFIDDPDRPSAVNPPGWRAHVLGSPTEQHPVDRVNWYEAVLFCNWLSRLEALTSCYERTGEEAGSGYDAWRLIPDANGYRLPTEAEWEYACRAGTETKFGHGDEESLLSRYAVYLAGELGLPGSKLPNGWGLFDMHGNATEWCHDYRGEYPDEATISDPLGPAESSDRVLRGGGYYNGALNARSALRQLASPTFRRFGVGFRVARTYP